MITGCDVSRWNDMETVEQWLETNDLKFMFIQASEGVDYISNMAGKYNALCESKGIFTGFYHYAKPFENEPEMEAMRFCSAVEQIVGIISSENDRVLLALVWEDNALNYPVDWIKTWMSLVHEHTGIRPVLYTSHDYVLHMDGIDQFTEIASYYGLWVARWNQTPLVDVDCPQYEVLAFHQYTDSNGELNLSVFNGDMHQLEIMGTSSLAIFTHFSTKPCQCGRECHDE